MVSLKQAFKSYAKTDSIRSKRTSWGPWRLRRSNWTLWLTQPGHGSYEIDLEDIHTSAQMLDWIFQIQKKSWCTPDILCNLLQAFQDLFDPQAMLCSFGQNFRIEDTTALLHARSHK